MIRCLARKSLGQSHLSRLTHHHNRQNFDRLSFTTASGSAAPFSASIPLNAHPSQFVAGATQEDVEQDEDLRKYFAANFPNWQSEPDKHFAPTEATADDDDRDSYKVKIETQSSKHAITLPESLTSRNIRPLVAYLRSPTDEEGTRQCYKMRGDRVFPLIPGLLHGSDPTKGILSNDLSSKIWVKTPWFEIQREIDRYHWNFENRVYALTVFEREDAKVGYHKSRQRIKDTTEWDVDLETMETFIVNEPEPEEELPPRTPVLENVLVIPTGLQMHPVAHHAFCLNFHRYHPLKPIKLPIKTVNEEESPALKRGGFINMVNKHIECFVEDGAAIPEAIYLECSGLKAKQVVRRETLIIPDGVTIHPRVAKDFLIGTVYGLRGGAAAEETEEEKK